MPSLVLDHSLYCEQLQQKVHLVGQVYAEIMDKIKYNLKAGYIFC